MGLPADGAPDTAVPEPTAPFVKVPPPGSAWVIKIENPLLPAKPKPGDTSPPPPESKLQLPVLLTVKSGLNGVLVGEITYNRDRQDIFYIANGSLLQLARNTGRAFPEKLNTTYQDPETLLTPLFAGTGWIARKHYVGPEAKNGIVCHHYAMIIKGQTDNLKLEAWIRVEDHYPLEATIGDLTYHYELPTSFQEEVELPATYREAMARLKAEDAAIDAMRKANEPQP